MRCIVPPNVTETSVQSMLDAGLPSPVARRVWQCRCLWLLSMHPEDIKKVSHRCAASLVVPLDAFVDYVASHSLTHSIL
jgi:hypothetical protein